MRIRTTVVVALGWLPLAPWRPRRTARSRRRSPGPCCRNQIAGLGRQAAVLQGDKHCHCARAEGHRRCARTGSSTRYPDRPRSRSAPRARRLRPAKACSSRQECRHRSRRGATSRRTSSTSSSLRLRWRTSRHRPQTEELYRTAQSISGLKAGTHDLNLTRVTFPPQMPSNPPHHRSGGAALLRRIRDRSQHGRGQDRSEAAGNVHLRAVQPGASMGKSRQCAVDVPGVQHQSGRCCSGRFRRSSEKSVTVPPRLKRRIRAWGARSTRASGPGASSPNGGSLSSTAGRPRRERDRRDKGSGSAASGRRSSAGRCRRCRGGSGVVSGSPDGNPRPHRIPGLARSW